MKVLIGLTMIAVSASAQANDATKTCLEVGSLAEKIMTHRQSGVAIKTVLSVAESVGDEKVKKWLTYLIVEAYRQPGFTLPEYQQTAINEYRDSVTVGCLKGFS